MNSTVYPGAYKLPSEQITEDPSFWKTITGRENELISQCMEQKGFSYTPSYSSQLPEDPPDFYGAVDKSWASVYGYMTKFNVAYDALNVPTQNPNAAPPPSDATPSASENALMGTQPEKIAKSSTGQIVGRYRPDGCFWQGTLAVEPKYFQSTELDNTIRSTEQDVTKAVDQSSGYLDARAKWQKCMASAGYSVTDPVTDPNIGSLESKVTPDSIKEALQDISCKGSTGFLKTWSRLLAQAQATAFDKHPGLLEEVENIQKDAYSRATSGGK